MTTSPPDDQPSNSKRIEREALVRALGGQLNALLSASRALMSEASTTFHPELPPAAFHIAHWLYSFGAAKVSQVAEAVAMDRSATSRLTSRLINLKLIEAQPDTADGRSIVLDLTDFGRQSIDKAITHKGNIFRQKIENWDDADLESFYKLLERFNSV